MRNRMYGGVRGRKTKVGEKLLRFPPTRLYHHRFLSFLFFRAHKCFFLEKVSKCHYLWLKPMYMIDI